MATALLWQQRCGEDATSASWLPWQQRYGGDVADVSRNGGNALWQQHTAVAMTQQQ
jgi:hypothetical protein